MDVIFGHLWYHAAERAGTVLVGICFCFLVFFSLFVFCPLDTSWRHLGRGNPNWENAVISLACRQVCGTSSWIMTAGRGPNHYGHCGAYTWAGRAGLHEETDWAMRGNLESDSLPWFPSLFLLESCANLPPWRTVIRMYRLKQTLSRWYHGSLPPSTTGGKLTRDLSLKTSVPFSTTWGEIYEQVPLPLRVLHHLQNDQNAPYEISKN